MQIKFKNYFIKLYKYKDFDIFFIINLIIIFLSLNIKFLYFLFHYIFYLNIDKMQFETIKFFKYEYFFRNQIKQYNLILFRKEKL